MDDRVSLRERMEQDQRRWDRLKYLASRNDVHGFYELYARYLMQNNVYSERREILIRMAKLVTKTVEPE